ncbi:MAG: 3,4-dihydroxy-2-butanone-4-phosphate synthase [Euryarchaeota archaeon]|nr:3,4-dihydroxy-2-butanone-4-phosphate synthase [Euryarchaeota archaeon]
MISKAIDSLKKGEPVLVFDAEGREEETDIVYASQFIDSEKIRFMRKEGGGLICTTLPGKKAKILELPYLHEVFENSNFSIFRYISRAVKYDSLPAFSITINHVENYTGISDRERAKTIYEFAKFIGDIEALKDPKKEFGARFIAPGHVHLLISAGLNNRKGHTELSTALVEMAELIPSATIVEMLGDDGYSLSKKDAMHYAREHNLVFVEGKEIQEAWEKWSE